jgi:hypothetical protein
LPLLYTTYFLKRINCEGLCCLCRFKFVFLLAKD